MVRSVLLYFKACHLAWLRVRVFKIHPHHSVTALFLSFEIAWILLCFVMNDLNFTYVLIKMMNKLNSLLWF